MRKKCIRDKKRKRRQQNIQRILEDFTGVKNIPGIKSTKKRVLITMIENETGEISTSRKGILNVLGDFYKKKYDDKEKVETEQEFGENENESSIDVRTSNTNVTVRIPAITTEELRTTINQLKKGKFPDSNGIRAEDIKASDDETREMVRQIFNEITKQNEFTPEAWKKVKIKVIHKKKEMWKILETTARSARCQRCTNCSRQYCTADFVHDSTKHKRKIRWDSEVHTKKTGHLATYRMIDQKCHEWRIKVWTAITHKSIWNALKILRYRT